jgi:hypothetical protein
MKYFIAGLFLGIACVCSPLFSKNPSIAFYPQWAADLTSSAQVEISPDPFLIKDQIVTELLGESIKQFSANGSFVSRIDLKPETLVSMSANGKYYVSYKKIGDEVEFFSTAGERFWKIHSQEYPYLSPNAKMALLLVADLSGLRFVDFNGNIQGSQPIGGRFCTALSFARKSDWAAVGFFDGTVFVVTEKGEVAFKGTVPQGNSVKSIALGDNGSALAVHYGTPEKDGLMIALKERSWKSYTFNLPVVHHTKTALCVDDEGTVALLNGDALLLSDTSGEVKARIALTPVRPGHSALVSDGRYYALTYRKKEGGSSLLICTLDGLVIMKRDFASESFLDCSIRANLLTARGLSSLYVWRAE